MASVTADLVMALNTTRCTSAPLTAFLRRNSSRICQEMASPSRSGSVARIRRDAPFMASAMSASRFFALGSVSQSMAKSSSGLTDPSLEGRSRTCP